MLCQNKNMKLMIEQINLFLTYLHSCNLFKDNAQFSRASKKHQFSTKTIKTKTNSTFKSWKCCFYADFVGGLYFNTRLKRKRTFRSKTVCWRSGRKNQGKAQARRFFRVTARGHSLPSAPAKKMIAETKTIIYAGRNTLTDEQGIFGRILMIHSFNIL